jgi:negative regulator of sigma E activity
MSELLREQMSAFVDDALPGEEAALLVRRLEEDTALTRTFACYQLIGASMRGEPDASVLVERVRIALHGEAPAQLRSTQAWRQMLKPAIGVATAASVAVVAIMIVRGMGGGETLPAATTATRTSVPASAEPASYTVSPNASDGPSEVAGKARLATYVMRHGNYATMPNSPVMNYRSLVGVGQHSAATGTTAEQVPPEVVPVDAVIQEPQAQ